MLKRAYVASMRRFRWLLEHFGLLDRMATSPRWVLRHVRTLFAIYDVEDLSSLGLPWWTYGAIARVESFLDKCPDARVFEYGSGSSTAWLARRCGEIVSVEHDESFGEDMRRLLENQENVQIETVPPSNSLPSVTAGPTSRRVVLDYSDYVASIRSIAGCFDLIVIDGRDRVACLAVAQGRLNPGGIIVFDDAQRWRYRQGLRNSALRVERYWGAKPTIPYPDMTAILRAVESDR